MVLFCHFSFASQTEKLHPDSIFAKSDISYYQNKDSARQAVQHYLQNALSRKDTPGAAVGNLIMGRYEYFQSKTDSAISYFEKGRNFAEQTKNDSLIFIFHLELSRAYREGNLKKEGMEHLLLAEALAKKINSRVLWARLKANFAEYFRGIADFPSARKEIYEALELIKTNGIPLPIQLYVYNRASAILTQSDKPDSSKYYCNLAIEKARLLNDEHSLALSENELGKLLEETDPTNSETHYLNAIETWKRLHFHEYQCLAMNNYARLLSNLNKVKESDRWLDETIQIGNKFNFRNHLRRAYDYKGKNAISQKDFESALRWRLMKDSLHQIITFIIEEDMRQVTLLYKNNEALQAAEIRNHELERIAFEEKYNRLQINVLFVSTLILMITLGFLFVNKKKITGLNKLLANNLVQKEALVKETHHRVKNNLSILSGMLHLEKNTADTRTRAGMLEDIISRIESIGIIHNMLYATENSMQIPADKLFAELIEGIQKTISSTDKFKSSISSSQSILSADVAIPLCIIVNELVTNSIKYAGRGSGSLSVDLSFREPESGHFELIYSDSGAGLKEGVSFSSPATFGLKMIKMMAEQMNGTCVYSNHEKPMFTFILRTPGCDTDFD